MSEKTAKNRQMKIEVRINSEETCSRTHDMYMRDKQFEFLCLLQSKGVCYISKLGPGGAVWSAKSTFCNCLCIFSFSTQNRKKEGKNLLKTFRFHLP